MRRSIQLQLAGTTALLGAVVAAALALLFAGIVTGAMLRYADDGAAQSECMTRGAGPGALVGESTAPVGELSAWPLGLRCVYPAGDGGTTVVEPDLTLSVHAAASAGLAAIGAAAWSFGRERRRLARHHQVIERRVA